MSSEKDSASFLLKTSCLMCGGKNGAPVHGVKAVIFITALAHLSRARRPKGSSNRVGRCELLVGRGLGQESRHGQHYGPLHPQPQPR